MLIRKHYKILPARQNERNKIMSENNLVEECANKSMKIRSQNCIINSEIEIEMETV